MAELAVSRISTELVGRRVRLRPLREDDYEAWSEVRSRCRDWLLPWEPRPAGAAYPSEDRTTFVTRCSMRERERQLGTGYGFGIFAMGRFAGEVNISSVTRGAFQNAYVGYWVDQAQAGRGYVPEACVLLFRFAFEEIGLHRLQISIIPRNRPSRRVAQKLWPSLPRDRRAVGGPRPLRLDSRGMGRAPGPVLPTVAVRIGELVARHRSERLASGLAG